MCKWNLGRFYGVGFLCTITWLVVFVIEENYHLDLPGRMSALTLGLVTIILLDRLGIVDAISEFGGYQIGRPPDAEQMQQQMTVRDTILQRQRSVTENYERTLQETIRRISMTDRFKSKEAGEIRKWLNDMIVVLRRQQNEVLDLTVPVPPIWPSLQEYTDNVVREAPTPKERRKMSRSRS